MHLRLAPQGLALSSNKKYATASSNRCNSTRRATALLPQAHYARLTYKSPRNEPGPRDSMRSGACSAFLFHLRSDSSQLPAPIGQIGEKSQPVGGRESWIEKWPSRHLVSRSRTGVHPPRRDERLAGNPAHVRAYSRDRRMLN